MYRAYHAPVRTGEGTLLRNAQGLPTNAVYIFVNMLRKLLKEHNPQFIAASFDLPGRTFRDDLAADYKANRAPMPDELAAQIPLVHRACEALGVPILTHERYEADDVIGTLTVQAEAQGYGVAIVTGDKDFFQLVRDGIRVYNPREEGTWFDADTVKEKFGVTPDQVVDALALMGDTIDNVKGVPGIGEKGARDLIGAYGTLDALLEHAAEVPQKRYREALIAHADEARASRELLRIHTNVPVTFDPEALRYRGPSREDCYTLFSELAFRSLMMEYAPDATTTAKDYRLIGSIEELRDAAAQLRAAGRFALRVLPDSTTAVRAGIVGIAFSTTVREARYVPLRHQGMHNGPQLSVEEALAVLKPVFEDPAIVKVGHDLKNDVIVLERQGVRLAGLGTDTMLASYLLDATRSGHPLEDSSLEHLGYKALTEEAVCGRGAKALTLAEIPADAALDYACERADLALQLADSLEPQLAAEGLDGVYRDLERPLIPVLAAMERAGVRIDARALAGQSHHVEGELATRSAQIFELAGEPFNINSPKQLSMILFEKLKLPTLQRGGKTSTAVDILEELALAHDLPRLILEWRALQKLKGTYID
ncbi:MAG: DNA polymerase, partial [Polyangiales bacterium]